MSAMMEGECLHVKRESNIQNQTGNWKDNSLGISDIFYKPVKFTGSEYLVKCELDQSGGCEHFLGSKTINCLFSFSYNIINKKIEIILTTMMMLGGVAVHKIKRHVRERQDSSGPQCTISQAQDKLACSRLSDSGNEAKKRTAARRNVFLESRREFSLVWPELMRIQEETSRTTIVLPTLGDSYFRLNQA